MARRKQEVALQSEIETQEEWEDMLAKEGLTVVDIYQEWSGPCKAMVSNFRRLKNELGDDHLRFSVAKADTIDALENYRGKCQPCFVCFAGGVLVAVVRGCNSPLLLKTITEQLAHEHKVLEGQAERKEIRDPLLATLATKEKTEDEDEEEEEEVKKGVTFAIIKPDLVAEGKVDEVLNQLKESGIDILEHNERTMSEEEAREFYAHRKDEEYFEGLITYMTQGPSHYLVLSKGETGEGIIEEFRELLGPTTTEEAKEQAPESFRAKYGKESYVNALHGSDTQDNAMKELAFFFPDFVVPVLSSKGSAAPKKAPRVERTLALIRPDAMLEKKDEILAKISEAGFTIAMTREVQLTREQAEDFYKEHKGQDYFEELTNRMCSAPLLALALARDDAVSGWRDMLGPKEVDEAKEKAPESLRAQFSVEGVPINTLHGSDSADTAEKELDYFFPMQQTVAVIKPDAYQTKEEIMDKIKEAGFHIAARKETELTKDIAETFYKDQESKEYFGDLVEHMTSGPTLFMVLSKENAVEGWRSLLGPTDPSQAKENNPNSLRAQFGTDIKANAVHGSSNEEQAQSTIKLVFGDLEFNKDGTLITETKSLSEGQEEDSGEKEKTQVSDQGEAAEKTEESEQQETTPAEGGEETPAATQEGGEAEAQQSEETEQKDESQEQAQQEGEDGEKKEDGETQEAKEGDAEGGEGEEKEPDSEEKPAAEGEESKPEEQAAEAGEGTAEEDKPAESGEEKPAESEEKTAESEEKPAEQSEEKPAEAETTEEKPADSEEKPAENEEKPAEQSEEKPAEPEATEEKPAESEEKPAEEEKAAEGGEEKPAEGGEAAAADDKPAEDEAKTS